MEKPTKAQIAALKRIAAHPNGTYTDQFGLVGVDGHMRRKMVAAGLMTWDAKGDGYRLTSSGRTAIRIWG